MLTPDSAGEQGGGDADSVALAATSSARTGWGWWWWWAPCAVRSTMVCCGKWHQDMCRSEAGSSDESKRRSDRRDRKSCIMLRRRGATDHSSAHENPLRSTKMETDFGVLADVLVDELSQKGKAEHEDPLGRSESFDCMSTSSTVLPSARCGGCPVAGMPIPPGHRCSWCHTCPHPGPSVHLELADGN